MPNQLMIRLALALLLGPALIAPLASCCTAPPVSYEMGYGQIDSPEVAYRAMKGALLNPDTGEAQSLFYYLLSVDVRSEYPLWQIQQGWDQINERLGIDLSQSELLAVEYLQQSPFAPRQAARVTIQYPDPQGGGSIKEDFLMLLELDYVNMREKFPQWRVYYPYPAYQSAESRTRFAELQEQQRTTGTPATN